MASYPDIPAMVGTKESNVDPLLISRSRSNRIKARRVGLRSKKQFNLLHRNVTDAQRLTLEAFYSDNRSEEFDYTYKGVTYTCIYGDPSPSYDPQEDNLQHCAVVLLEV